MRFVTFQPNSVLESLKAGYSYKPEVNYSKYYGIMGFNPIFMCKLVSTRQILTEYLGTCTTHPQSIIVFDTNKFKTISKLGRCRFLVTGDGSNIFSGGTQEYITNEIDSAEFVGGEVISACTDVDKVQDNLLSFMENKPYEVLNKYIQKNFREKLRIDMLGAPVEYQKLFLRTVTNLNFDPLKVTDEDIDRFYRHITPKMIKTVGK